MKKLIIMLMCLYLTFACQTINVSSFSNQTINMSSGCIILIDDTTLNTVQIDYETQTYNLIYLLNPNDVAFHAPTNITCVGNDVSQNIQYNLSDGQVYNDSVSGNKYVCANVNVSCSRNVYTNVSWNMNYTDNLTNTTVIGPKYPQNNIYLKLDWNSNKLYQDNLTNTTIIEPDYPYSNSYHEIYGGDTYVSSSNDTVKCMQNSCLQNVNQSSELDSTYYNEKCNITIYGKKTEDLNLNEIISSAPGTNITSSKYNITCAGFKKYNIRFTLDDQSPNMYDDALNLTVDFSSNLSSLTGLPVDVDALGKLDTNSTECIKGVVCLNKFKYTCSGDELLNGVYPNNIYGCWDRLEKQRQTDVENEKALTAKAYEERDAWKDPKKVAQDQFEAYVQLVEIGAGLVLTIVVLFLYFVYSKKSQEANANIPAPKRPLEKTIDEFKKGKEGEMNG